MKIKFICANYLINNFLAVAELNDFFYNIFRGVLKFRRYS